MSKSRKISDTEVLATWFFCEVLGQEWDYRLAARYLAEARDLVNPKQGASPIPIPIIKGTIKFMEEGRWDDWDRPVTSLRMVMWGQPPFYKRYQERVEHRSGLIEQQHLPLTARPELRQHPRQVHALTLAAGQSQVAAHGQVQRIGRLQRLLDDLLITQAAAGVR